MQRRAPDGDGDVPLHRHRGLDAAAAGARRRVRRGARRAPSAAARGVVAASRRRGRHRRATRSSSRSRVRRTQWRPPARRSSRWQTARCACGWASTRASRSEDVEGYVGLDVHRAARIAAAGHGGQVLLSQATADLAGVDVRDLGLHRLKDLSAPERLFQLGTGRLPAAEDAARDEPARSGDAVSRTGAGDSTRSLHCCGRPECPARDADRAGRQRQDAPCVCRRRPRPPTTTTTGSGGCRSPRSPIPRSSRAAAAQALGAEGHARGGGRRQAAAARCSTTSSICSTRPPSSPRRSLRVRA